LIPDGETTLYTSAGAVDAKIFKRRCIKGSCIRKYDGFEDCIYRSSPSVACSWEMGWEFVDLVMTSRQTFSGFVKFFINNNNTTGKRADVNKAVSELANHVMGKNKLDQEKIDEHLEMVKHDCKDKVIVDVVNKLFVQSVHPLERGSLAKVLHVLTTDASITNTIPFPLVLSESRPLLGIPHHYIV